MTDQNSLINLLAHIRQICEGKELAESTITKKLFLIRLVLESIEELTAKELQRFFKEYRTRQGKPLSPHTRNRVRIELKWVYRHVLNQNPPSELTDALQKEYVRPQGKKISAEDLQDLLQFAPSPLFALAYQLLYDSGMRPYELLSITAQAVGFPQPDIALIQLPDLNPKTPSGRNKTGGRPVLVQGSSVEGLRKLVHHHTQAGTESSFLFPWAHKTLSSIFCQMKNAYQAETSSLQAAGSQPVSSTPRLFSGRLYDLRHTAATRLAAQGLPDQLLRRTMGWSQASRMPTVYIHLDASDLVNWQLENDSTPSVIPQEAKLSNFSHSSSFLTQLFNKSGASSSSHR